MLLFRVSKSYKDFAYLQSSHNVIYLFFFILFVNYRYENKLRGVDIFVFTADPTMEPQILVVNTILSAMSYNYPPEKLSVYLSDDGGFEFTFYALLEASHFSLSIGYPFVKNSI